jgi:hypothetical protein
MFSAQALAQSQNVQDCDFRGPRPPFPKLALCAFPGLYQDSSLIRPGRCVGLFQGPQPDSVRPKARTVTVRFLRDRVAEARPDFGAYRIYRVINAPDTSRMMLIRRFSKQEDDEYTWSFSTVEVDTVDNATYFHFKCRGQVVHDSVVTFIDPDSSGNWVKLCRRVDHLDRCLSRGDSVFKLIPPPGPHDGIATWYAITYEAKNTNIDATYEEMFVPDSSGNYAQCDSVGRPLTCPNANHKANNMTANPVEPTGGPRENLDRVAVVPNPFRAREVWDRAGPELHFINLPQRATIKVYTIAGDLVAELQHNDRVQDFERWNLKNQNGRDVASGIYIFRVEADRFTFQNRFVVIR